MSKGKTGKKTNLNSGKQEDVVRIVYGQKSEMINRSPHNLG